MEGSAAFVSDAAFICEQGRAAAQPLTILFLMTGRSFGRDDIRRMEAEKTLTLMTADSI